MSPDWSCIALRHIRIALDLRRIMLALHYKDETNDRDQTNSKNQPTNANQLNVTQLKVTHLVHLHESIAHHLVARLLRVLEQCTNAKVHQCCRHQTLGGRMETGHIGS